MSARGIPRPDTLAIVARLAFILGAVLVFVTYSTFTP